MRSLALAMLGFVLTTVADLLAEEPGQPRPVPLTRPEMKRLLEDMKTRKPRIPLPELTDEEKTKLGERGTSYEARLRSEYLPAGDGRSAGTGPDTPREPDPAMSLDYRFKTELFWIVSRTNNCQYCMGHQESKLLAAGMKEDEIAALDGDWTEFADAERAAFAFARKLTYQPELLNGADVDALRKHYKDLQILEMILSTAGNNSINRWKEGVGVPQSANGGGFRRKGETPPAAEPTVAKQTYLTPTSEGYKNKITKVAPFSSDKKSEAVCGSAVCDRPALESKDEVEKSLEAARIRTARLPLLDEKKTREVLGDSAPVERIPQWMRLLANFPKEGKSRLVGIRIGKEKGDLKPLLKAQVSWIIARQDRAWYAAAEAKSRLKELGWSDDRIYRLDGNWADFTPTEQALFTVARKLAASPVVLTDDDVAKAVKSAGPRDVVQLIVYTTNCAYFDRITEAAGLQSEK